MPRGEREAPSVSLRPATPDDRERLFEVHRAALGPYVEAIYGWDEADQRGRHAAQFEPEAVQVIELDGAVAGFLRVEERPGCLILATIELEPAHQGRGVGTRLVGEVLAEGERLGLPVRLRVLHGNPAQRLYARLGFEVTGETKTHVEMEARPPRCG